MKFKLFNKPKYEVVIVGEPTQYMQRLLQHELQGKYCVVRTADETTLPSARLYVALSLCASAKLNSLGVAHVVARSGSAAAVLTAIQ